jgi:hypothetical protein
MNAGIEISALALTQIAHMPHNMGQGERAAAIIKIVEREVDNGSGLFQRIAAAELRGVIALLNEFDRRACAG